jgi:hypothetical protein
MPRHLTISRALRYLVPCFALLLWGSALAAPQQEQIDAAVAESARNFKFATLDYPMPEPHTAFDSIAFTNPIGINDAGLIVGLVHRYAPSCQDHDCFNETFLYEAGKFSLIHGPLYKGGYTVPIAINNRNQILIVQDPQSGPPPRYFIYDIAQQTFRPVGSTIQIAGAPVHVGVISGVNDQDEFAGSYNYRGREYAGFGQLPIGAEGSPTAPTDPGNFTQIACPDNRSAVAGGLNNRGEVTGFCESAPAHPGRSGFIYRHSDHLMNVFDYPGAEITQGVAINDAGAVIGHFTLKPLHAGAWPPTAFAYDGSKFTAVAEKPDSHGDLIGAHGIDNKGRIVGDGAENGSGVIVTPTAMNPLIMSTNAR